MFQTGYKEMNVGGERRLLKENAIATTPAYTGRGSLVNLTRCDAGRKKQAEGPTLHIS
jgi:hypothetical protein